MALAVRLPVSTPDRFFRLSATLLSGAPAGEFFIDPDFQILNICS
jgi:hypothetical protein